MGSEANKLKKSLNLFDVYAISTGTIIDKQIKELDIPDRTLIAMVYRNGRVIVPTGKTRLKNGDRLTFIGDQESIAKLNKMYSQKR